MDLKPGDVVILKSGGAPLTVAEVNDDRIACVWMGEEGDLFHETLPAIVLEHAILAVSEHDGDEDAEGEEEDEEDETSKVA